MHHVTILPSEMDLIKNTNGYYDPDDVDYYENRFPNSYDGIYPIKDLIKSESSHVLHYLPFKLPLDYYHSENNLNIEVPEVLQSINANMFHGDPTFLINERENKIQSHILTENDAYMNQDLKTSIQHSDEDSNINPVLKAKFQVTSENESALPHMYKNNSDTKLKDTYTFKNSSPKKLGSNSSINPLLSRTKSRPNQDLKSLSSEFTVCDSNETNCSIPVSFQQHENDPEIVIIKDLHQPISMSVRIEGLYSPNKLIRKRCRPSPDLCSTMHQNNKIESYKFQKIQPKIYDLSSNNCEMSQISSHVHQLQSYNFNNPEYSVHPTKPFYVEDSCSIQIINPDVLAPIKDQSLNVTHWNELCYNRQICYD